MFVYYENMYHKEITPQVFVDLAPSQWGVRPTGRELETARILSA